MKTKVSNLDLYQLDYLVAKAEGLIPFVRNNKCFIKNAGYYDTYYSPTTNPSQAWPIIERERITIDTCEDDDEKDTEWMATNGGFNREQGIPYYFFGKTSLEAAMRCYVASKFGDEVDMDNLINK